MKNEYWIKRAVFPYFAKALNDADYNGEKILYEADVQDKAVHVMFPNSMGGNFLHNLREEAQRRYDKDLMMIRDAKKK